jgi:hypothetical protein
LAKVKRFDLGQIRKAEITPQGYLKADAFATRVGVFKYTLPDGTVRRELRPPEEVFKSDSMKSLAELAVTNEHPPQMLDATNTKNYQVGFTNESVERLSNFLKVGVNVTDADAIREIKASGKTETSCGYTCEMEETPGVWNGEKYDAIQRDIMYNHLAVVKKGRAGSEVRIRLDAADAVQHEDADWDTNYVNNLPDSAFAYIESGGEKDEDGKTKPRSLRHFPYKNAQGEVDLAHLRNALARAPQSPFGDEAMSKLRAAAKTAKVGDFANDSEDETRMAETAKQKKDVNMAKVTLDGVDYEVSEAVAAAIVRKVGEASELKKETEALKGRCDAADAELKASKEALEKAKAEKLDTAAALKLARARIEMEGFAKDVLGKDQKFDSMTDQQLMRAVISKKNPEAKLDGKSDEYVAARFDVLRENHKPEDKLAEGLGEMGRTDSEDRLDSDAIRAKVSKESAEAWKTSKTFDA